MMLCAERSVAQDPKPAELRIAADGTSTIKLTDVLSQVTTSPNAENTGSSQPISGTAFFAKLGAQTYGSKTQSVDPNALSLKVQDTEMNAAVTQFNADEMKGNADAIRGTFTAGNGMAALAMEAQLATVTGDVARDYLDVYASKPFAKLLDLTYTGITTAAGVPVEVDPAVETLADDMKSNPEKNPVGYVAGEILITGAKLGTVANTAFDNFSNQAEVTQQDQDMAADAQNRANNVQQKANLLQAQQQAAEFTSLAYLGNSKSAQGAQPEMSSNTAQTVASESTPTLKGAPYGYINGVWQAIPGNQSSPPIQQQTTVITKPNPVSVKGYGTSTNKTSGSPSTNNEAVYTSPGP